MSATLDFLFDEPAPRAQPPPQHTVPTKATTDIEQWFNRNGPRNHADLQDLRKALYSRRTHGRFTIQRRGETYAGEEKFTVSTGQCSLLIVSNKSRHYLLRKLCRLVRRR